MADAAAGRGHDGVRPHRSIGQHGIVGDLETAALIARDAAIDYLCWPALDSPSVFAELLDADRGGAFTIRPALDRPHHVQLYVPDTNVLLTRWMAEDDSAEVQDLMPHPEARPHPDRDARCLIRRVTATRGRVTFAVRCSPRFDYAREVPTVSAGGEGIRFTGREPSMRLFASVALAADGGDETAEFTLEEGASAWFVLGGEALVRPDDDAVLADIAATTAAWRRWAGRTSYTGRWREGMIRSALALKLLTSARHGSIAAAAPSRCPRRRARGATGTIAPPGFATRRSPSMPFCGWASWRRPSSSTDGRARV